MGKTGNSLAWAQLPAIPSWTWPGHEGNELTVEVFSRYPSVRLYLNDKLIGEKPTALENEFRAEFKVLYDQGTLKAVGVVQRYGARGNAHRDCR